MKQFCGKVVQDHCLFYLRTSQCILQFVKNTLKKTNYLFFFLKKKCCVSEIHPNKDIYLTLTPQNTNPKNRHHGASCYPCWSVLYTVATFIMATCTCIIWLLKQYECSSQNLFYQPYMVGNILSLFTMTGKKAVVVLIAF